MSSVNPLTNAIDIARLLARQALSPAQPAPLPPAQQPAAFPQAYRPEPAYHPQIAPQALQSAAAGNTCAPGPSAYGPGGFSEYVQGQQARELDVDLMRMSYAAYDGGPDSICGWTEVSQEQLIADHGWDPEVRLDVPESQFSAKVFSDGQGNYVLAYRGTADGAADWQTNFEQGAGLETTSGEFEILAPMVAQQFAEALGGEGGITNLAITGHSQGGGLATVGSLVTGIPAVTFDASGIHPNTLENLGLDIGPARQTAEDGLIRRYSLHEDALTQLQERIPGLSLAVPDALGHHIVLKPEGDLDSGMIDRALEHDTVPDWLTPEIANLPGVSNLVRAVISHDQQLMIDTMLQQQPWQPGYTNPPPTLAQRFNDLVPDAVQDDYARNVSDLVQDVQEVIDTQFADGNYVEGAFNILGDLGEGFANTVGDTVSGYADHFADGIRHQTSEWGESLRGQGPWGVGDGLAIVVEGFGGAGAWALENGGGAFEWAADGVGDLFETVVDFGGKGAQLAVDGFVATVGTAADGLGYVVDAVGTRVDYALGAASTGWNTVADKVSGDWNRTVDAVSTGWDRTTGLVSSGWNSAVDTVSSGASWVNDRMPWNW